MFDVSFPWRTPLCRLLGVGVVSALSAPAWAQVVTDIQPDASLPNASVVNGTGQVVITGGTADQSGNLFHSFSRFSVGEGDAAIFDTGASISDINNIITRVTGGVASVIFGELQAGGTANMFLINPSGITFGPEATINIGGSFFASTADSVEFEQLSFSAVDPTVPSNLSLLTVNTPIGLQYGSDPGAIAVEGFGHDLFIDPFTFEIIRDFRPTGLAVGTGQTLALLGGELNLTGGNLTAPEGRVELGALGPNSRVQLIPEGASWAIAYDGTANFQDIAFSEAASVDVSGAGGGDVQVRGRELLLRDGSAILSNTLDAEDGGQVTVRTSEGVTATGVLLDPVFAEALFPSGIFAEVAFGATGAGSQVTIQTPSLSVTDGAQISTTTFGDGDSGALDVVASQVNLAGQSADGFFFSGLFTVTDLVALGNGGPLTVVTESLQLSDGAEISSTTFGEGAAGDVSISARDIRLTGESGIFANVEFDSFAPGGDILINTDRLSITEGSQIASLTFGFGDAGNIVINARNVELSGGTENFPSGLFAIAAFDSFGNGGSLSVTTDQLRILDGAQAATSTAGFGDAGNLVVQAGSVILTGSNAQGQSGLFATALEQDGNGGNVVVTAEQLAVQNGATISASTFPSGDSLLLSGLGAAGNVEINARRILLDNQGRLTAETAAGDRGNINIRTDSLVLRRNSSISTNAIDNASGGNIRIDAPNGFIIAFPSENSDISANAVFGDGGRVDILAQGIFGIEPRLSPTPLSDITASSEFGVAGEVNLTQVGTDPSQAEVESPQIAEVPELAQGCQATGGTTGRFVDIGQGGVRPTPYATATPTDDIPADIALPQPWADQLADAQAGPETAANSAVNSVVEAQGWVTTEDGHWLLVADLPTIGATAICN